LRPVDKRSNNLHDRVRFEAHYLARAADGRERLILAGRSHSFEPLFQSFPFFCNFSRLFLLERNEDKSG
jgi:hypothetical protein